MRIRNNTINDNTVIELGKFTVLWNMFERDFCSNTCNPKTIIKISPEITMSDEAQKELADILNTRRTWFEQDLLEYIQSRLHPNGAHQGTPEEKNLMQMFLLQSGEMYCGCLLVINRIRNNLLHGLKCVSELDSQIELFKAVNKVLESISKNK